MREAHIQPTPGFSRSLVAAPMRAQRIVREPPCGELGDDFVIFWGQGIEEAEVTTRNQGGGVRYTCVVLFQYEMEVATLIIGEDATGIYYKLVIYAILVRFVARVRYEGIGRKG